MLKHPLLYSSSRPKLDTLQKPYVPKEKRVNLHVTEYTDTPPQGLHKDRGSCHFQAF